MPESESALVPDAAHAEGDAAAPAGVGDPDETGARSPRVQQLSDGLPDPHTGTAGVWGVWLEVLEVGTPI